MPLDEIAVELVSFNERARSLLRLRIEQAVQNDSRPERDVVHWYIGLATLAWDVSGSVIRLLATGDVRAASILNRSLFEYRIRMLFYATFPNKASQAIRQLPTRLGRIDKSVSDLSELDLLSADERIEFNAFVSTGKKIQRENFRTAILEEVMSKNDADRYYEFFYAKASAWVHGYETMLADVLSDHFHNKPNPQPHWVSRRLDVNDTAAVTALNILDTLDAMRKARSLPAEIAIEREWVAIKKQLGNRGLL